TGFLQKSLFHKRFDLRLMSWGDATGVPTSGNNLVVIGTDNNNLLHIRIFDQDGHRVTDTDETKLPPAQAQATLTLKQRLPGLLPPHELTDTEKAQVFRQATSIVGQTLHEVCLLLDLNEQPDSVARPMDLLVQGPDWGERRLSPGTLIVDV